MRGFVAQQINDIVPSAVKKFENKGYALNQESLLPIAVSAIQKQQKTIEALKQQIQSMQSEIDCLKQNSSNCN